MQEHIIALREALLRSVARYAGLPVLLSGGIDSATIVAALLAIGARPVCYTFGLSGFDSDDVRAAAHLCRVFDLQHHVVRIPQELSTLTRDVVEVIRIIRRATKTHVQCAQPMIHVGQALAAAGYDRAWVGLAAGDLMPCGRKASEWYRAHGDRGWRRYRDEHYHSADLSDYSMQKVAQAHGLTLVDAYRTDELASLLLSLTYDEIMKPKPKYLLARAFPEFYERAALYRRQASFQIVGGLRAWHDTLLQSPLNTRQSRAVVGIYRDILRQEVDHARHSHA